MPVQSDTVQLAQRQKVLLYLILAMIALYVLGFAIRAAGLGDGVGLVVGLVHLVVWVASIVFVALTASSAGKGAGVIVLVVIGMLIPLINLIVLLVVNNMATTRLREAGLQVGLMGVSPDQLRQMQA